MNYNDQWQLLFIDVISQARESLLNNYLPYPFCVPHLNQDCKLDQ